jgi:outer membrane murein-binding lipoprotein Lpp
MLEKAAPVAFLIANVQQLNARIDELEALLAQFKPPEKPA